jgi:hypothetical protein
MSLSPLDDYPVHQIAQPVRRVGTSDRNFYDRYYFNAHPCSDDLFLITGMGMYPNLGVADAFVCVLHENQHRVVRASRELGNDRMDTSVGPFRVEVIEGLKRLRVVLEPNEWDLAFDLTWDGAVPAHLEPNHVMRSFERITFDSCRLAQTGCWTGAIELPGGKHVAVTPDHWWGSRDRSWGVRPVGEPEPPGIGVSAPFSTFYWNYAPMQFEDFAVFYICQETRDGTRVLQEAVRAWPDGGTEDLGRPEHQLTFVPGTRDVERALLTLGDLSVTVEPLLPCHLGIGTGYGFDDDWRHGMYQGPLKVQGVTYDLDKPEDKARMMGIVDSVARFELTEGDKTHVGYGLWEYFVIGPHDKYGFTDLLDGAP